MSKTPLNGSIIFPLASVAMALIVKSLRDKSSNNVTFLEKKQ